MWNTFDLRETLVGILHSRQIVKLNLRHSGINPHSTLIANQQLLNNKTIIIPELLRLTFRFSVPRINKVKNKNRLPIYEEMVPFKDSGWQNISKRMSMKRKKKNAQFLNKFFSPTKIMGVIVHRPLPSFVFYFLTENRRIFFGGSLTGRKSEKLSLMAGFSLFYLVSFFITNDISNKNIWGNNFTIVIILSAGSIRLSCSS